MKFYRHLNSIKAMTFDLDDTLYDNRPVIRRVEADMVTWLHKNHPISATKSLGWWQELKLSLASKDTWLPNDVTQWRFKQIEQGLILLGYSGEEAHQAAQEAIDEVLRLRSDFVVPQETHRVMALLSRALPLVAITNGNVNAETIGLSQYFSVVLKAGPDGYAKPHADLFNKAALHLDLEPNHILHVGDHLISDVQGAKSSGFQACWFNDQKKNILNCRRSTLLPDVEITQLDDLLALI